MPKHFHIITLFVCLLMTSAHLSAKNIQYVSDELTIPMRSGASTSHKILKFLTSGVAVDVLEETDDKTYARIVLVGDESKSGWVKTELLMPQPSAREQIEAASKNNQSLKDKQTALKNEMLSLQKKHAELQAAYGQLEHNYSGLQNTLIRFKESAADPIRIAEDNEQLSLQLQQEQQKNIELVKKNAFLGDQNIKQWFLIGSAVSIGSLILGLLITRIRWKKRDSWAGSF